LDKQMAPIQACIAASQHPGQSDSEDMLAEEESRWHHSRRTTYFKDDSYHNSTNHDSASAAYDQTVQQQGQPFGSPNLDMSVRESEDDLLLDSPSKHTVLTTACSADDQHHTPSSLDEYPPLMLLVPMQQSVGSNSRRYLNTLHTVQPLSDQSAMASHENSHEPLFENDVSCTEELLPIPRLLKGA
jgi:hypothetical protein